MAERELLTVFGATGTQGGSLIDALLNDAALSQKYRLRGITRDVNKDSAKALAAKGVEMVQADMNDPDTVVKASEGSSVIFGMTDFWSCNASAHLEEQQGRAIALAASRTASCHLLIFSTLPSPRAMSGGRLTRAALYEGKAAVEAYIQELGLRCVFFVAAGYMDLLKSAFFLPEKVEKSQEGEHVGGQEVYYTMRKPFHATETQLPWLSARRDVGAFLFPVLRDPGAFESGTRVYGASGYYSMRELVETMERVTGRRIVYEQIGDDEYWDGQLGGKMDMLRDYTVFAREYDSLGLGAREELGKWIERFDLKPESLEDWMKRSGPFFED